MGTSIKNNRAKSRIKMFLIAALAIADEFLDCLNGGENCPFDSLEDFEGWFESNTGLELPVPDMDMEHMLMECLSGGEGCPTLDEAINFIQEETGGYISDEVLEVIYNCAEDILAQLGFGGARK